MPERMVQPVEHLRSMCGCVCLVGRYGALWCGVVLSAGASAGADACACPWVLVAVVWERVVTVVV